ncbi:MAG: hypothetical protein SF187_11950 [Deltaproteobacteria bacterium]|nr:hypothetical protein [Deltaproteobacteria bacterium]
MQAGLTSSAWVPAVVGIACVIVGIVWLRLSALFSLAAGALAVALLTPAAAIRGAHLQTVSAPTPLQVAQADQMKWPASRPGKG